jgi:glucan-binding YG repeat protein
MTSTISYKKDKKFLFVCCNWEKYQDFFLPLEPVKKIINGKQHFVFSSEKETKLVKIINYLNTIHREHTQKVCVGSDDEESDEECDKEDRKEDDRMAYFKSFASKNFVKQRRKEESSHDSDTSTTISKSSNSEEYSSSSYGSSSSDDFPSPRTPRRKITFSNEDLFIMIEEMKKRLTSIEQILSKKLK